MEIVSSKVFDEREAAVEPSDVRPRSIAWHLFLLGYQDPTIDGNYELRNVADHRLRTCRRDASR